MPAQHQVAVCYAHGIGVEQSDTLSLNYFRLAADQGNSDSQFELAQKYEHGYGVETNMATALQYYQLAAAIGNAHALHKYEALRKLQQ